MPEVALTAGPIEYQDAGKGPTVVLLHGLLNDESVWRHVAADLSRDHRCVIPTLPLGSHRKPMRPEADLSLNGHARIVAEFIEHLALGPVTLVQSDHGTAQVLAAERPDLVERLVLGPQEAFENYPPGLPGKLIGFVGKLPGGVFLAAQQLRIRAFRRTPLAFGWMSKRVPQEVMDGWFRPAATQRAIRRDVTRYIRSVDKRAFVELTEKLSAFDKPALVVWTPEDRVMPPEHGRRFAQLLPNARLVEIDDSYTLVSEDQPARFAQAIRDFVRETPLPSAVAERAPAT